MHRRVHGNTLTLPSMYHLRVLVGFSSSFKRLESEEPVAFHDHLRCVR